MNKKYFKLQLKRVFKIYPTILLVTLITVISIAVTCVVLLYTNASSSDQKKISIGIVGDMSDSYLNIGLSALKNIDSSNLYIEWLELSEAEAQKELENRNISGYIHIPEDYVKNIFYGKNIPAKYVMLNAPEGFGTIISAEIAEIISDIVVESQVGMYSMQNFAADHNVKNINKNNDTLMFKYIDFIINRNDIYNVTTLGIADSLSFAGYYVCSLLLIFMLLWGISCNRIFISKNNEYSKLLSISGISPRQQLLCEYCAYLIITLTTLFLFAIALGTVMQYVDVNIPELIGIRIMDCILFIIKILPVIIMITLMQTAIYELIPNTVAAILMQFILTIVLGYISGCFYPNYFFPEILQNISNALPIGVGFSYIRKAMSGFPSFWDILLVAAYSIVFFRLAYCIKNYKITGDVK